MHTVSFCDELQVTAKLLFRCPLLSTLKVHFVNSFPPRNLFPTSLLLVHSDVYLLPTGITLLGESPRVSMANPTVFLAK